MKNGMHNVSVVHLIWLPFGKEHFKKFIDSYLKYTASYPHQLVFVFNGTSVQHPDKTESYINYLEEYGIKEYKSFYFDAGQDIDIYQKVAASLDSELVIFLNSYSEIRANNWLSFYIDNFDANTGIISATASCQSYYSSVYQKNTWRWETGKGFNHNFRKYKLFIKAFFYWRFLFKPFPNPHVRTNAFMVRRTAFLEIRPAIIDTKFKAYIFESGNNGLSGYYIKKGLKLLVVDKYGKPYEMKEWQNSFTFWRYNQENLLVSDNQTGIYDKASTEEKRSMTKLAWGINE
ncbi:MAG: hypothetical protein QM737_00750 [Ferruginibacter sp.]